MKTENNDILYVVAPAYNETDNIEFFINDWYKVVDERGDKARLVVVDDGSKDNTYDKLKKLSIDRPKLIPLTKENGGHGAAVLYAYRFAIEQGAGWIFQTDSDGQTSPDEFDEFWELRYQYDAILGDRQSGRQDGGTRIFVENVLRSLIKIVFGVSVPDANAPFRLMRAELVSRYIQKMPMDFNLPNVMLTTYFAFFKEKLTFRKISFKPRNAGKNSINMKRIIAIGVKAIGDFIHLRRHIND